MQVHSIDHLNLTVSNLQQSIDWYERVFGFKTVESGQRDSGPWAILRAGDAMLCMYEDTHRQTPDRFLKDNPVRHVIYHWGIRITERAAWLETVERLDLQIEFGGEVEHPHSSSWYISDPTGYSIEVTLWKENTIHFAA